VETPSGAPEIGVLWGRVHEESSQTDLFSYQTKISLRAYEQRPGTSLVLLALVLLLTAAMAALVLAGVVWFASADLSVVASAIRELLVTATPR
jgi:hypothetical protein